MNEVSLVALERKGGLETWTLMIQSRGFGKAMLFLSPAHLVFKRMLFYLREQYIFPYLILTSSSRNEHPHAAGESIKPRESDETKATFLTSCGVGTTTLFS